MCEMKKFYAKISKQQWRMSVPGLPAGIFRKSPTPQEILSRNSGSYDFQQAQKEYDRTRSLPGSVYVNSSGSSNCSSDEGSDNFEDARTSSNTKENSEEDFLDSELYVDVDNNSKPARPESGGGNEISDFEYDVPRISFSFFKDPENFYENRIEEIRRDDVDGGEVDATSPEVMKSEVKIVLEPPVGEPLDVQEMVLKSEAQEIQIAPLHVKTESIDILPLIGIIKCGSDPTISIRENSDSEDDDGLYKIPRKVPRYQKNRMSQSLNDFNIDAIQTITSNHSSIEHISCSQVIPQIPHTQNMEYVKARSKLPLKLRRPTFLRKPSRKAIDKLNDIKTKFNNMMSEQAEKQRVGVWEEKDRVSLNDMYKNSKMKCRNVLKSTSKFFQQNKKQQEASSDSRRGSDANNSNHMVKNDAFFAKVVLTPNDIEYKFDRQDSSVSTPKVSVFGHASSPSQGAASDGGEDKFDFNSIKSAFRKSKYCEGQNGFEDLRRYVKQGGDFCKELSTILQERAETETQYAKSLSKLSSKLARACREGVGGLNEAWKSVAIELETRAEVHRLMGNALLEETARPLRTLTENQHRTRKQCEGAVDKAAKSLGDWRAAEAKGKKQSHTCARDNEKLQDAAVLDTSRTGKLTLSRSTSLIQMAHKNSHNKENSDKENAKLEGKKRKAEDAVKKADIEYYTLCVRAERARLEWESAVLRGVNTFQSLEEDRLNNLKTVLSAYLQNCTDLGPRLVEASEKLKEPISEAEPTRDLCTFINLRQSSQQVSEQLLPDFYCEHITLAMNRERRKQALVKLLHLIRQDIERERKSKNGLENLSKAMKQTPNFGAEDSQQSVGEKLYHMKSMLTYLEGARYKVHNALAELDSRPRSGHPLAPHITITRDKSGLQQSILKVPQWLREEWFETERSPLSEKSLKSDKSDNSDPHNNDIADPDWTDRGAADGNSNQPDSDFDEFSSQCSSGGNICKDEDTSNMQPIAQCKALYAYTPNLTDELALQPGDMLSVYRQQDDGWWLGECKGNVGIFPATYVELIN